MYQCAQTIVTHKWNRLLALSIIPITLGLVLIISIISGTAVIRLAKENLTVESKLQAQLADSWLSDTRARLSVYRNILESRCVTDEDILDFIAVSNLAHEDFPVGVYVGTSENRLLEPVYYVPDERFSVTEREWYSNALHSSEFCMSEPYTDVFLNKPCVTLSVQLRNPPLAPRNDVSRVMAADVYLDYINRITREMILSDAISGGMFVSKEGGVIVANSTGNRIGELLYDADLKKHLSELASYADGDCVTDTLDGETYYVNILSLQQAPWYLITYVDVHRVRKELYLIVGSVALLAVISVAFLFILIKYFARRMDLVQNQAIQLSDRLAVQSTFVEVIQLLTETQDFDGSINKSLQIIGDFYQADRAYIFSLDYERKTQTNTYEWCTEGVTPQIENLKNIPLNVNERWWKLFERNGYVKLTDISRDLKHESHEYEILNEQKITSLLAYPFIHDGVITGFIGLDNPRCNLEDTFLIESASVCVSETLMKKQYTDVLYDRSYKDILTGCKNRRAYFEDIAKLTMQKEMAVGVVYADLNGLKDTNDTNGHDAGDKLIIDVMHFLDHCFDCHHHEVYRIGGDEFVVFVYDIEERAFHKIIGKTLEILEEMPVVSIGESWISTGSMVERQIAEADTLMYIRKKDFYREKGHDRRRKEIQSDDIF